MRRSFRWDDFHLDAGAYRLERAGQPVALEPKALDVLLLLVARRGRLVPKQEIFDTVWAGTAVTDHALTRVIAQLRRALGDDSRDARYIETVPTRGYRWVGPDPSAASRETAAAISGPADAPSVDTAAGPPPAAGRRYHPRLVIAGVAVLLVAVLGLGALWMMRGRVASEAFADQAMPSDGASRVAWPVQVTTHGGLDLDPALSPRGDALAFASDRSGQFEIYVRPLADAATDVALTGDGGHNVQPAWSPDGNHLAYHSARDGGIWVIPARGGVARQIVREGSRPAWSPDGTRIAYQTDEHADVTPSAFGAQSTSAIWMVERDGRNARAVTRPGQPMGGHAAPAWSPDGRYLGFTVFEGAGDDGAWLADVDTGAVTRLLRGYKIYELAFAPDGSALYAAGGEALVYRIPFDARSGAATARATPLAVAGVAGVRGLSVAADGSHLAFAGLALSSQIWAQPLARDGAPSGPARALTDDTSRRNSMAVISPDGSKVAYVSSRRGEAPNVWVMRIDGTSRVQLTSDQSADGKSSWFPDSRRVAYFSNRGESVGLWAIDVETRREELVLDLSGDGRALFSLGYPREIEMSPSMTRMALGLVTRPHGQRRVFVTPLDRFEPRAMNEPGVWAGYPAWSPDERHIAVEIKEGSSTHAGVIDVDTGRLTRLTNEPGQTWVRSWSPDGRRIAVAALRRGLWSLLWIDVATGRRGVIVPPGPPNVYVRYPEWSRRDDVVVYERGELRGNIWTLAIRDVKPW